MKKSSWNIQPCINSLQPYQPGISIEQLMRKYNLKPKDIIKLASNENPLGPSPKSLKAIRKDLSSGNLYPDGYELIEALAKYYKLDQSQIILGNGSNDVLDLIARVFLGKGQRAISDEYAFLVYALVTKLSGSTNTIVRSENFGLNMEAIHDAITANTSVIWIANPNNPTGTFVEYSKLKPFLKKVPKHIIVVLDEAYYEYLSPEKRADTTKWLKEFPNLILVRTFSKIYGLAGFRVGYAMASSEIIELLNRVRQPFNVSSVGLRAAQAALSDRQHLERSYELNVFGQKYIQQELDKLNIKYLPINANFITIELQNAQTIFQELLARGIIVRNLSNYGMPSHLRVTIGKASDNLRLIKELTKFLD